MTACSSSTKTSDSGTVTLHVEGWKGGGAEPANVAQINAAFQRAYPKIKLDYSFVPPDQSYQEKLQAQLLAGNAADVIMVDSSKVQSWGKSGYLADLSQSPWVSTISANLKPFATYNSKVLAAPMELSPIGMFANLDLLHKAGVSNLPTDWPTFLQDLGKLKAAHITPISLPDAEGFTASFVALASAATTVYQKTPDWDQQFLAGTRTFAQDWQTPLQQLKQLGTDGYVDWTSEVGTDENSAGLPGYVAGKSAFFIQGAWAVAQVQKGNFSLALIPWPGGEAGVAPSALFYTGTMWSATARSKHLDAAKTYVDFWAKSTNLAPYLAAEQAVSPYTGDTSPANPVISAFEDAYKAKRYWVDAINTWDSDSAETAIRAALQKYLLGKASADQTLQALQTAAEHKS